MCAFKAFDDAVISLIQSELTMATCINAQDNGAESGTSVLGACCRGNTCRLEEALLSLATVHTSYIRVQDARA